MMSFEQSGAGADVISVDAAREISFRLKRKSYNLAIVMHAADNILELSTQIANYCFVLFHHDKVSHPVPLLNLPINYLRALNMSEYMLNIISFLEIAKDSPVDVFPKNKGKDKE
jgi:hypothetical protein